MKVILLRSLLFKLRAVLFRSPAWNIRNRHEYSAHTSAARNDIRISIALAGVAESSSCTLGSLRPRMFSCVCYLEWKKKELLWNNQCCELHVRRGRRGILAHSCYVRSARRGILRARSRLCGKRNANKVKSFLMIESVVIMQAFGMPKMNAESIRERQRLGEAASEKAAEQKLNIHHSGRN